MGNAYGIIRPEFWSPLDENIRSPSSRENKGRTGTWDPKTITDFDPSRWLKPAIDDNEKLCFDQHAGPISQFGLGPRGCAGRKLAYLQLKIAFTMIVWNFELQQVPKELNSYDAEDFLTHNPQQCYVRLRALDAEMVDSVCGTPVR